MPKEIYLDNHAATRCDPRVVEAMLSVLQAELGNPSGLTHSHSLRARKKIDRARMMLAERLHCRPSEIVFTSGATESNNLALKGLAATCKDRGNHIITTVIEHKSVLDPLQYLEKQGWEVTYLPVDGDGRVRVEDVERAIRPETFLVSVQYANNEVGSIAPVGKIGRICKDRGIFFHTDAAQALLHLPCDVEALGVDLMSLSAHKAHGPMGVGALYVRSRNPRVRLEPLFHGGGQEKGIRSGTLNTPAIVGFGKTCELVLAEGEEDTRRVRELRDLLWRRLKEVVPDVRLNGSFDHRLPNNLNVSFPGIRSKRLIETIEGVSVSSGSACSTGTWESSYVLRALPEAAEFAESSIRFGLGRFTTRPEVEEAVRRIAAAVRKIRSEFSDSMEDEECGL